MVPTSGHSACYLRGLSPLLLPLIPLLRRRLSCLLLALDLFVGFLEAISVFPSRLGRAKALCRALFIASRWGLSVAAWVWSPVAAHGS